MNKPESNGPTRFNRFGLDETLVRGIYAAGFGKPRPIQSATIPAILEGRDVLGLAQTGTGKTAAFALPLLDRILRARRKGTSVLIVAPTRELANQITEEIRSLARHTRLKAVTIYGGVPIRKQVDQLRRKPEIVVGCPGRILDLFGQNKLHLAHIESLVIDEADHLFDMGFLPDIKRILAALPHKRQNLLFSATMPQEIRKLADDLLNNPEVVEMNTAAPVETIDHALIEVPETRKRELLEEVLKFDGFRSAIIFTRTKMRVRRLTEALRKSGHRVEGIQGNLSQSRRDQVMAGFRKRKFDILVATDIVARGIDVSGVSHVINYDVPNTPEAYTHRVGRTGRAELEGNAFTFVTYHDAGWLRATERMIGEPIPRRKVEGFTFDTREPKPYQHGGAPRGRWGGNRSNAPGGGKHPGESNRSAKRRKHRGPATGRGYSRKRSA